MLPPAPVSGSWGLSLPNLTFLVCGGKKAEHLQDKWTRPTVRRREDNQATGVTEDKGRRRNKCQDRICQVLTAPTLRIVMISGPTGPCAPPPCHVPSPLSYLHCCNMLFGLLLFVFSLLMCSINLSGHNLRLFPTLGTLGAQI